MHGMWVALQRHLAHRDAQMFHTFFIPQRGAFTLSSITSEEAVEVFLSA